MTVAFSSVQSLYDWLNDDWILLRATHTAWITRIEIGITVVYPGPCFKFESTSTSDHDQQKRDKDQHKEPPY